MLNFEDFAHAHIERLIRLGVVVTGSQTDSEDFAQEALEHILRKWNRVSAADHSWAYARQIAVRRHFAKARKRRHKELLLSDPHVKDSVQMSAEPSEELANMIQRLPPRQRTVIVLRYFEDLETAKIAARIIVLWRTVGILTFRTALSRSA